MVTETVRLRINEFHQRHGGECYLYDGFYWYADGAYRDEHPLGVFVEPPKGATDREKYEVLERSLKFYKGKLNRAVNQFESLRESLTCLMPPDADAALRRLEELREAVV